MYIRSVPSPSGLILTVSLPYEDFPLVLNPLNAELNPIRYLLALLGAHHFLHVSRIRVNFTVTTYSAQKNFLRLRNSQNEMTPVHILPPYLFNSLLIISSHSLPTGILRLPWLRFFRASSSVVRQIPGYTSQRRGTVRTLPNLWVVVLCIVSVDCVVLRIVCV